MDALISRKAAIEVIRGILNTSVGFTCVLEEMISMVEAVHSIPAVPLDKLCEWLARNAYAFECEDCEEYCRALLDCENEVGSDPKYWENKLTKWMEENTNDTK